MPERYNHPDLQPEISARSVEEGLGYLSAEIRKSITVAEREATAVGFSFLPADMLEDGALTLFRVHRQTQPIFTLGDEFYDQDSDNYSSFSVAFVSALAQIAAELEGQGRSDLIRTAVEFISKKAQDPVLRFELSVILVSNLKDQGLIMEARELARTLKANTPAGEMTSLIVEIDQVLLQ